MNILYGQNEFCMGAKNEINFIKLSQKAAKECGVMREIFELHTIGYKSFGNSV